MEDRIQHQLLSLELALPAIPLRAIRGEPADTGADSFTIAFGPGEVTSKDNIYGFYMQDTWKLTRKLTINAGLR